MQATKVEYHQTATTSLAGSPCQWPRESGSQCLSPTRPATQDGNHVEPTVWRNWVTWTFPRTIRRGAAVFIPRRDGSATCQMRGEEASDITGICLLVSVPK